MRRFLTNALDFVFPPAKQCLGCGTSLPSFSLGICVRCQDSLPRVLPPFCARCGKPIRVENSELCTDCRSNRHVFERNRAFGVYEGLLKELIYRLKYCQSYAIGGALGTILGKCAKGHKFNVDVVTFVPLHPERLRLRGYNQAEALALPIAKIMDVPLFSAIHRVKDTEFQSSLSPKERKENLANAFFASKPGEIAGKSVLVVDDIYTTGSTLNAVAATLLRNGAIRVQGICAAIGVPKKI